MKLRLFALLMTVTVLFAGCTVSRAEQNLDNLGETLEQKLNAAENAMESAVTNVLPSETAPAGSLTKEEAAAIALKHAGLTADQVSYLRTDYEIDDGIPQYEVDFHYGRWEYDYEIQAETGEILSYDRDD